MSDTGSSWQQAGSWPVWSAVAAVGTAIAAILGRVRRRSADDQGQTLHLVTELVGLLKTANETIVILKGRIEDLERKVDELSAKLDEATAGKPTN